AHLAYDGLGRVISATDRLNRTTTYTYDAGGRLVGVTRAPLGIATYARDDLGRVTRITDQRGKAWDLQYSPMGRLTGDADPLGNQWGYSYDERGRLTQASYSDGNTVNYTYDAASNITQVTYSGGPRLDYTYDAAGRLLTASDGVQGPAVGVTLTYDARGDITTSQSGSASFGATYDNGRRLQSVSYPLTWPGTGDGQVTVTYAYETRDLLTRVEDDLSGAWVTFTYDADRRLTQMQRSNGVQTTFSYDAAGRVTRILDASASETLADQQYTLNAEGEPIQIARTLPLDPVPVGPTADLSYDDAGRISNPGYVYDARGRQIAAPEASFTYDSASRLTQISANGTNVTLTYNALGSLSSRTVNGTTTTYYHHYALGLGPIVAESVSGSEGAEGQGLKAPFKGGSRGAEGEVYRRFYVYTPEGSLLYSLDSVTGAVRFYHFDRVGSTLFLTDESGMVSDAYAYTPYGVLLGHSGVSGQSRTESGTDAGGSQPFTYIGRYGVRWEPVGGLYQMGARYYDPLTTRFLTRDPIWPTLTQPQALNPYQYAYQNPLRYVDPLGMQGSQVQIPGVWWAGPSEGRESVGKEVAGRLPGDAQPIGTRNAADAFIVEFELGEEPPTTVGQGYVPWTDANWMPPPPQSTAHSDDPVFLLISIGAAASREALKAWLKAKYAEELGLIVETPLGLLVLMLPPDIVGAAPSGLGSVLIGEVVCVSVEERVDTLLDNAMQSAADLRGLIGVLEYMRTVLASEGVAR
ncbi:MAG: RHS repeat-associated core domain-containing protein, partial [Chloroflexi bacterium]|nr:RHS repeat-associated core domain-containing protein [Chloroflexota bacterium]